ILLERKDIKFDVSLRTLLAVILGPSLKRFCSRSQSLKVNVFDKAEQFSKSRRILDVSLSSFNNLLVKSDIIFDNILNNFESFSDSIQILKKISPVISFNRGLEVSIRDINFFMVCLLFLSNSAKKNSSDLSEILDQLTFSEGKGVVKFLKVRA
ncbi:hypothetical protein Tco_0197686, partial [Tanacetum coccineum]